MDLTNLVMVLGERVPHATNEYRGEDGFLHCGVCHARVERRVTIPELGIDNTMRCICDCVKKAKEERRRAEERERKRMDCFGRSKFALCTFESIREENNKISDALIKYTEQFKEFRAEGRGILLSGNVGTGKSTLAACVANRLIDNGYSCKMVKLSTLINRIQETFDQKQEVIDSLNNYSLLILDDLGVERKSEYMQEQVYSIIDARYCSGLPFIITTNLSLEEIKKPQDLSCARIYDRILERCVPIVVDGASKRRQSVKASYEDTKKKLGL